MSRNKHEKPLTFEGIKLKVNDEPASVRSLFDAVMNVAGATSEEPYLVDVIRTWELVSKGATLLNVEKKIIMKYIQRAYAFPMVYAVHKELFDE